MAPPELPVRALLLRLGLTVTPTLQSTGTHAPLAPAPADEAPTRWTDAHAPRDPRPTTAGGDDDLAAPPPRLGRYEVQGEIGRGGMGRVYAAHDPELARDVAVKVVRGDPEARPERIARFVSEAQITAQLEHPSIVPLHDVGVTEDGAVFYVMKQVRGRSLRALLDQLEGGDEDLAARWPLHRLLTVFVQICDAVGFAHDRGVLHRDLKPDNLLVGDFGEVLVVDWGLATLADELPDQGEGSPASLPPVRAPSARPTPRPVRRSTESQTEDGATLGTPGYMSPEQARGEHEAARPPSDVFGLGCVLYELLTLRRAYAAEHPLQLLFQLMAGPPVDPALRAPERRIPREIADLTNRALASAPADRPSDARILADLVREFLDGRRRREAAAQHLAEARRVWEDYEAIREAQGALSTRVRTLDAVTPAWTPMADKAELLEGRTRLDALGSQRVQAFSAFVTACDQARAQDPESPDAAALLAQGWWARLLEAEEEGDPGRAAWCADRVRAVDDGRFAARLEGVGALSLATDPDGAEVICQRVLQEGVVWGLGEPRSLGRTPLRSVPLPMGSWVLTLRAPGKRDTTYPVLIRRGEHWEGGAPIPLFTEAQLGADWIYVPGGPFLSGGDPLALDARPSIRPDLPGFLIGVLPISLADYARFINGLAIEDPEAAWARVPRAEGGVHRPAGGQHWVRPAPGERYVVPEVDVDGDRWEEDWPLLGVNWHDAMACAAWCAGDAELPIRLPTAWESEKAARGVDGRIWPWGDRFDATLCLVRDSRPGRPRPAPVGSFVGDVSVYGVRDAGGGIRELCGDVDYGGDPERRPARGASWNHLPDAARCASSLGTTHWNVSVFMGARLARGLPDR